MNSQAKVVNEAASLCLSACVGCPVCECSDSTPKFTIPDFLHGVPGTYTYVECCSCGTVYQDPRIIDADLPLCYPRTYFTHSISGSVTNLPCSSSSWRGKIRNAVLARADRGHYKSGSTAIDIIAGVLGAFPPVRRRARFGLDDALGLRNGDHRCLDIGCGNGTTLSYLKLLGWQCVGLEVDESAAENSRRASGCEVRTGTLNVAGFRNGEFDLIHMSHVIEHLPDIKSTLQQCFGLLSPQGRLVVKYPNPKSLVARMSGKFAVTWDPPRHLVLPPREAIVGLLRQSGFEQVNATTLSQYAAMYRAVSRQYRKGLWGRGWGGAVSTTDRLTKALESFCILCGWGVGEEILVVAYKNLR